MKIRERMERTASLRAWARALGLSHEGLNKKLKRGLDNDTRIKVSTIHAIGIGMVARAFDNVTRKNKGRLTAKAVDRKL